MSWTQQVQERKFSLSNQFSFKLMLANDFSQILILDESLGRWHSFSQYFHIWKNPVQSNAILNLFRNHILSWVWVCFRLWNLWWEKVWLSAPFPHLDSSSSSPFEAYGFPELNLRPEVERGKSNLGQRGLPWGRTFLIQHWCSLSIAHIWNWLSLS